MTKENAILLEDMEKLKNHNSVLNDTITVLSQEKRQLQQQLDTSRNLSEQFQRKIEEQKEEIKQLQPGKLRRIKMKIAQLRNEQCGVN